MARAYHKVSRGVMAWARGRGVRKDAGVQGRGETLSWRYWRTLAIFRQLRRVLPTGGERFGYLLVTSIEVRLLLKNSMLHNRKYFVLCET
jgi:hypothetical protein